MRAAGRARFEISPTRRRQSHRKQNARAVPRILFFGSRGYAQSPGDGVMDLNRPRIHADYLRWSPRAVAQAQSSPDIADKGAATLSSERRSASTPQMAAITPAASINAEPTR
jgi:hypothetical protein